MVIAHMPFDVSPHPRALPLGERRGVTVPERAPPLSLPPSMTDRSVYNFADFQSTGGA